MCLFCGNETPCLLHSGSLDLVWASLRDLDCLVWFFVGGFELLDELESAHSHDNATKDHILVVKEGQWSTHGDVELRLVGVAQTVSLAHAEHADLLVLDLEGLILELATIDGGAHIGVLGWSNLAHLKVHALDDAVDFRASVADGFVIWSLVAVAKSKEVGTGTWSEVVEELKVDGGLHAGEGKLELGVLASLGHVDHLAESCGGIALVDDVHRVVHVGKSVEDVSCKLLSVADVFAVVEHDQMAARVVVEDSL